MLREEIFAVLSRHVTVDPNNVQISVDRGIHVSTLAVDIDIPNPLRRGPPRSCFLNRRAAHSHREIRAMARVVELHEEMGE